jgi:hypothetical protein
MGSAKAASNLAKHGFDFDDAIRIFHGPVVGIEPALELRRRDAISRARVSRGCDPIRLLHNAGGKVSYHQCQEGEPL